MYFPLNELQIKLGYKFENIQLLHEALTHDFDSRNTEWDILGDGNVFYPKRKLHRLKCVGVSVLKLLIVEKAVIVQTKIKDEDKEGFEFSDEGFLTDFVQRFHEKSDFYAVGCSLKLWNYIDSRDCVDLKNTSITKEVIQAIFGAVFIDGGGCESKNNYAIVSVRKVFDLFINKYDFNWGNYPDSEKVYDCFSANHHIVRDLLLAKGYALEIKSHKSLEKNINYSFEDPDLIKTALLHDSVKSFISDVSHYEVLEFLGDAVYELVICDYLFWHYINDRDGKVFNSATLTKFVSKNFQQAIAKGLDLKQYIIKPSHVTVNDTHDFLESVLGAMYVDARSLKPVNKILIELGRIFEEETVANCNVRLPHNLRTYYGSKYYIPMGNELRRITEDCRLPPKRQNTFEVKNLDKLKSRLGNYYESNLKRGTILSYDSRAHIVGPESWCNQQEFGRCSLFETMNRLRYLDEEVYVYDTAKVLLHFHTYPFHTEYPTETLESEVTKLPYVPESAQILHGNSFIENEPNFSDVVQLTKLWILKWIPTLKQMGRTIVTKSISFINALCKIGLCVFFLMILVAVLCEPYIPRERRGHEHNRRS